MFLHINVCLFFALGLCRQLVRAEWNETVSQRLGRFRAPGLQPQRPSGRAGISLSHLSAHSFILFTFSQGTPQRAPLPSEDKLQELLWQHFSDHRPLWWDDNLSLTSTRVLFSVAQQEVEDRGPAVVLRSHYRQTEQK